MKICTEMVVKLFMRKLSFAIKPFLKTVLKTISTVETVSTAENCSENYLCC